MSYYCVRLTCSLLFAQVLALLVKADEDYEATWPRVSALLRHDVENRYVVLRLEVCLFAARYVRTIYDVHEIDRCAMPGTTRGGKNWLQLGALSSNLEGLHTSTA